ncbi:MAG: TetR/AcrR family transcriptional regulator [Verrucomicrobia bacterium]|nr:TetR/AcrR family transcriptional regulator [Verrucomicrobiota bacterium]MBI3868313.1 TetR/AcrR family transcriptional regulator [Verrucomicrobiota bacterium]
MGRVSNAKQRLMEAVGELIWTGSYGSTTIDQICAKAGVKKGSFYYFFDSKADLAVTALDAEWQKRRPELDSIFSPTIPPLERLERYCDFGLRIQTEIKAKCGCALGCPLFSLGSEVSTQEDKLQKAIQGMLDQKRRYLESTIRDAHAAGLIHAPDAAAKARILFAYYQGLLTQVRIQNNVEVFREAIQGTRELLGVKAPQPAVA